MVQDCFFLPPGTNNSSHVIPTLPVSSRDNGIIDARRGNFSVDPHGRPDVSSMICRVGADKWNGITIRDECDNYIGARHDAPKIVRARILNLILATSQNTSDTLLGGCYCLAYEDKEGRGGIQRPAYNLDCRFSYVAIIRVIANYFADIH